MSFQDQKIQSTPAEQHKHYAQIMSMPDPSVPDLRTATQAEIREEVIFLRLFVASQLIGFKELAIKLNEVECNLNVVSGKLDTLQKDHDTFMLGLNVVDEPPDINYAGDAEKAEYQNIMETDVEKEMADEPQFVSSLSRMDELAKEEYNPFGSSLGNED